MYDLTSCNGYPDGIWTLFFTWYDLFGPGSHFLILLNKHSKAAYITCGVWKDLLSGL